MKHEWPWEVEIIAGAGNEAGYEGVPCGVWPRHSGRSFDEALARVKYALSLLEAAERLTPAPAGGEPRFGELLRKVAARMESSAARLAEPDDASNIALKATFNPEVGDE